MENNLDSIQKTISSLIDISDKEWSSYSQHFRVKQFKKKANIINEGDICRDVYFVEKGLLRIFYLDNNAEEKTFHFAMENTFATDYESLLKHTASNYSIQCLEDTKVILMSLDMLQEGYKTLESGEKLGRLLAEEYFFLFSDKIKSIYTKTPLERYNALNKKFPNILQRVPQHYIASYLNISSVHLSRLKNK